MTDDDLKSLFSALHDETAGETPAMIKFCHAELNRMRTLEVTHRTLEESVANLQARVERLESATTH